MSWSLNIGKVAGTVVRLHITFARHRWEAFPSTSEFAAAKIAILAASVCAGTIGTIILWNAKSPSEA